MWRRRRRLRRWRRRRKKRRMTCEDFEQEEEEEEEVAKHRRGVGRGVVGKWLIAMATTWWSCVRKNHTESEIKD